LTSVENLKALMSDGSHADSIARKHDRRTRTTVQIRSSNRVSGDSGLGLERTIVPTGASILEKRCCLISTSGD
jgi:hypothetical protein